MTVALVVPVLHFLPKRPVVRSFVPHCLDYAIPGLRCSAVEGA